MRLGVNSDVLFKAAYLFGGAPGSPEQAIDIGPKHSACMIERKKWIEASTFKFALAYHAPSSTFKSHITRVWKMCFHVGFIVWVLIGFNCGVLIHTNF